MSDARFGGVTLAGSPNASACRRIIANSCSKSAAPRAFSSARDFSRSWLSSFLLEAFSSQAAHCARSASSCLAPGARTVIWNSPSLIGF